MTETKVTGKKYRICTDATNDKWDRVSFWTKASDVEMNDGTTVEATITNLASEMTSLGESVADGKASVASAITAKGVTTASDASFETMASNIGSIASGGTLETIITNGTAYSNWLSSSASITYTFSSEKDYTEALVFIDGYGGNGNKVATTTLNTTVTGVESYEIKYADIGLTNATGGMINALCGKVGCVILLKGIKVDKQITITQTIASSTSTLSGLTLHYNVYGIVDAQWKPTESYESKVCCCWYYTGYSTTLVSIPVDLNIGVNSRYIDVSDDGTVLTIKVTGQYKLYGAIAYPSDSIPECYYYINDTATRISQYGSCDVRTIDLTAGDTLKVMQKQPNTGRPINNCMYLCFA